ncbi:unnamed protein product [Adineta steineri]|uniref:Uncharacterized protein n=1 Tax=Adineta steineri TaxID=433720 RepID=A0A814EJJ5_9BILA|nr:unnamed protein product [Adineta steineri]CAF1092093.1 unnamed protein product [Adineta steineri]
MFHIFRWRREQRNENPTSSDHITDEENKTSHTRRCHRLRLYHGKQSIERLFHVRRHELHSDHDKRQTVTIWH